MESWPPKNGESSTTPQSTDVVTKGQTSSEEPSNRVIMLLGLDPNTTTGMISKAFREHGLQVTVDYQRDDTIGYVQLYLDIAKEVAERIMSNGGLRIGTDVAVLRALEGMEDLMYWSVYAGAHIVTARSSPGSCKTSGKVRYQRRNNRQNPYQIMELEDGVDTLSSSSKYIRQNHQRMAKPPRRRKKKSDKTLNKSALKKTKASTKKRLSFMETEESTANTTPSFDALDDPPFDTPSFGSPPFDTSPLDVVLKNTLTSPAHNFINNDNIINNNHHHHHHNHHNHHNNINKSNNKNGIGEIHLPENNQLSNQLSTKLSKFKISTNTINTINTIEHGLNSSLSLSLSSFSVSNQIYQTRDEGETKSYNRGSLVQLPLCQEVFLRNKDESDEVEERLKNLHLNTSIM
ncbi:hypothetical protein Glove_262g36 [Diversispora epigaea]|uniref:Uncharacterized protein n=1 Tax=Diversispora epigaea TaxID=1348612 RepID=A0A397I5R8_9GLOM|nr:hypothetical protein Glove_262g36 [Diversispora epigaea]